MSEYKTYLNWQKTTDSFAYEDYNRSHSIYFGGEQILQNSSAPEYLGDADMSNPEELLASALSSCHMLTFLAIASKSGYNVVSYKCEATAILGKNEEGRLSVTEINLKPEIVFSGDKAPTDEQIKAMHEKAHRNCFIAQSLKTKVTF